ncbi:MAG: hypothetical protein JXB05_19355 [Myxococcaceae bacterium]|nr:hypothetical protein [Myxococcaceae bacterium]
MRFGAGWLSAGVAALLITAGCKEGKPVVEQEGEQASAAQNVEQAQERSEQAFDQAREAQGKASEEQEQAAQAQQDVQQAQRELEEAQAQAQTEAQQAQQAQQQAQQETQQAGQTASEAQASALEAQRQQQSETAQQAEQQAQQAEQQAQQTQQQAQQPVAAAPAPSAQGAQGEQLIVGEVMTASEREVLVSSRGEPQLRLQVQPGTTTIIVDGRPAKAVDIQEGSQVRASYRDMGGEPTATRIEVTTSRQPAVPAAPESGEPQPGAQPQEAPVQGE